MSRNSRQMFDARTIAREVGGLFEAIFPQLVPGVVAHFNRTCAYSVRECKQVSKDMLDSSSLQRAMLFELSVVLAEMRLTSANDIDWGTCLNIACSRQRAHFDAQLPKDLAENDKTIAHVVSNNLVAMLNDIGKAQGLNVRPRPRIPGYSWIATSEGDFATEMSIIEVKCSGRRFSTADYRQLVMYWLLSYIQSLERDTSFWRRGILVNPRLNLAVALWFEELLDVIAVRRSLVEIVEMFRSLFDDEIISQDS